MWTRLQTGSVSAVHTFFSVNIQQSSKPLDFVFKLFLPLGLVFIMFSLGLGLTTADFRRVWQRPYSFLVGAFNQIILLPIVAFATVLAFGISGEFAVGFMILAACPGGVTSNVIAQLAKADVALSVSLTAVISLISVITVPVIVAFAYGHFLADEVNPINVTSTAITMFALTVVPIGLAMTLRAMFPSAMLSAAPVVSKVAVALFGLIVIAALVSNWSLFIANAQLLGGALVCLMVILLVIGFVVPLMLGRSSFEAKTISIETGVQNSSLGIVIAALIIGGDTGFTAFSIPAAVYGIVMYLVLIPVLPWLRKIGKPSVQNGLS